MLKAMEPRVFVVHVNPDSGLAIFSVARKLGMVNAGYVWIATDWLSSVIDSSQPVDSKTMELVQGVVTVGAGALGLGHVQLADPPIVPGDVTANYYQ